MGRKSLEKKIKKFQKKMKIKQNNPMKTFHLLVEFVEKNLLIQLLQDADIIFVKDVQLNEIKNIKIVLFVKKRRAESLIPHTNF